MRRHKFVTKILVGASVLCAGGTVLGNGCINTLASINLCGTVLPWCTPADQLNLLYPMLETPDFRADNSCTIPLGCGATDLYNDIPEGFPGGGGPEEPEENQRGLEGGGGV